MSNEQRGPTAEEIARAMIHAQEEQSAKSKTMWSNVLGWAGLLVVAPAGVAAFLLVSSTMGESLCVLSFLMVIVGAIIGSVGHRQSASLRSKRGG
jgi:hypothetical protein